MQFQEALTFMGVLMKPARSGGPAQNQTDVPHAADPHHRSSASADVGGDGPVTQAPMAIAIGTGRPASASSTEPPAPRAAG